MNKTILCAVIVVLSVAGVRSHSWLDQPPGRFPPDSNYCQKYDNGTFYTDQNGNKVCGKDAQAVDLLQLRPKTYNQNPCYYPAGATYNNAQTSVVEVNGVLCMMWAANSHNTDPTRDNGGGVRISLSKNVVNPTQSDFDSMIIAKQIGYDQFAGAKVQLPNVPAGEYLIQFYWYWPNKNTDRLFVTCSNLSILASGDPRLKTQQSTEYGMGLPPGTKPDTSTWHCNAGDTTYSNSSLGTSTPAPTSTTSAPTTKAPTTAAPTTASPTTKAPTTAAPTTQAPSTSAPTTKAPTTAAPTTQAPTTATPTTQAPSTPAPTTQAPTNPSDHDDDDDDDVPYIKPIEVELGVNAAGITVGGASVGGATIGGGNSFAHHRSARGRVMLEAAANDANTNHANLLITIGGVVCASVIALFL